MADDVMSDEGKKGCPGPFGDFRDRFPKKVSAVVLPEPSGCWMLDDKM